MLIQRGVGYVATANILGVDLEQSLPATALNPRSQASGGVWNSVALTTVGFTNILWTMAASRLALKPRLKPRGCSCRITN